MPSLSGRGGRHRKPEPSPTKPRKLGRVIIAQTIFVLLVGAIFVSGYLAVWYLISDDKPPSFLGSVPPETNFAPPLPAAPATILNIDKECSDFFDQNDAQKYFIAQGGPKSDPDDLDMDNDGLACENYDYNPSVPPSKHLDLNPKFYGTDNSKVNVK